MRALLLGTAFFLGTVTMTAAADAPPAMAGLFGNTVEVVDDKGIESHTHYSADGTFDGVAPAYNYHYKGTWTIDANGQLCRNFDPVPPGVTNPDCNPLVAHAVGDSWSDPDGGTGKLVAGTE
ncbi:MAG: hypothetical protein JSR60_06595 [Proteobacteria bacterium]|nr:hypothetical protein [Pseudomonadota bacterium]